MEQINVVNDTQQAVVEPASQPANTGGIETGTPAFDTQAEPAVRQSRAENSGFRKLRLENEGYKQEIENLKKQLSGLSELEQIKKQNSFYINKLASDKMEQDLNELKKIDPKIQDLAGLGEDFIRLIENGIDVKVAYLAVKEATLGGTPDIPPSMGAVGYSEGTAPRFFSSKELDRLTAKDLENPKIFKKAMESLKKL